MHDVIDIPWWRLASCAGVLLVLLGLNAWARLGIGKELSVAAARGPLQLLLVGYLLTTIFALDDPWLVFAMLLMMLGIAAHTATRRLRRRLRGLGPLLMSTIGLGTGLGLVLMSQFIVQTSPWYDPQYLIPFGGMLLGNCMNATAIGGERFQEELRAHAGEVEARLALGFTAHESTHPMLSRSVRASLIPILNSLASAGLVQLPGMMTGQVLSGTDPVIAVKYQILIFALLLLALAISVTLFLNLLQRRYITKAQQLRIELLRD